MILDNEKQKMQEIFKNFEFIRGCLWHRKIKQNDYKLPKGTREAWLFFRQKNSEKSGSRIKKCGR